MSSPTAGPVNNIGGGGLQNPGGFWRRVVPDMRRHDTSNDGPDSLGRAYQFIRAAVGVLGVSLPILLIAGDALFLDDLDARGSLSAYYHSGMRDIFVGTLLVIGFFLITYKVFKLDAENVVSILAGIAASGVAIFPTKAPAALNAPLTPLQIEWGADAVKALHTVSTTVFLVCIFALSVLFAVREWRGLSGRTTGISAATGGAFHTVCASVIAVSGAALVVMWFADNAGRYGVLIFEAAAVFAFGASWLAKGAEDRAGFRARGAPSPMTP
jgi:hypothetical protein